MHYSGKEICNARTLCSALWLSIYISVDTKRMWDALVVFYHWFMKKDDRSLYLVNLMEVYWRLDISHEARDRIREIHKDLAQKALTDDGRKRKTRIVQKLIHQSKTTRLIMGFYMAVLPILKAYTLFQTKEPLVHLLYRKQQELVRDFLQAVQRSYFSYFFGLHPIFPTFPSKYLLFPTFLFCHVQFQYVANSRENLHISCIIKVNIM